MNTLGLGKEEDVGLRPCKLEGKPVGRGHKEPVPSASAARSSIPGPGDWGLLLRPTAGSNQAVGATSALATWPPATEKACVLCSRVETGVPSGRGRADSREVRD